MVLQRIVRPVRALLLLRVPRQRQPLPEPGGLLQRVRPRGQEEEDRRRLRPTHRRRGHGGVSGGERDILGRCQVKRGKKPCHHSVLHHSGGATTLSSTAACPSTSSPPARAERSPTRTASLQWRIASRPARPLSLLRYLWRTVTEGSWWRRRETGG